jgi:hypothetical protein
MSTPSTPPVDPAAAASPPVTAPAATSSVIPPAPPAPADPATATPPGAGPATATAGTTAVITAAPAATPAEPAAAPAQPAPGSPSPPPPGFNLRWGACHVSIAVLVAILAWLGLWKLVFDQLPEKSRAWGSATPVGLLLFFLVAPAIPKVKEWYNPVVNYVLWGFSWLMLRMYDWVYHVRHRRTFYLRLALLSSAFGAPALGILVYRLNAIHIAHQKSLQALDHAWDSMMLSVCDNPIDEGAREKFTEFDRLFKAVKDDPPAQDDAGYQTLFAVHDTFAGLYRQEDDPKDDPISFPGRCGKAAEGVQDRKISSPEHCAVCKLLKARLYLRASQNGALTRNVDRARAQLVGGLESIEADEQPRPGVSPRLLAAYHNYLGVAYKLQAQKAYMEAENKDPPRELIEGLAEAYKHYELSRKLADENAIASSRVRAQNNLTDWWLLICAIHLDTELVKKIDWEVLPDDLRERVSLFHKPAHRVARLEKEMKLLEQGFRVRPTPVLLVTMAQTECLLALACHQNQKAQPQHPMMGPTCEEARKHLHSALARLEIAADVFFDEKEIFAPGGIRRFHLEPLQKLDPECKALFEQFLKNQNRDRDR